MTTQAKGTVLNASGIVLFLMLTILPLVLTGCGAADGGGSAPADPAAVSPAQPAPAAPAAPDAATPDAATAPAVPDAADSAATSPGAPATAPADDPVTVRLGGMTGPTSIGMVKLLNDAEEGIASNQYEFTLAGSADELTPKLIRGELDAAAVPANLAAVLYNNTQGAIRLLAVNTLGVTYIVDTGEDVRTVADLKGKTVYCTAKGSAPEYTLRYILSENGLDPDRDLTLEWKSEPAEAVALLGQSGGIAMLPQPYVTVAQGALPNLRIALDLTKEWEALDNGSMMITGVMAVRADFAAEHPAQIAGFLEEYRESAAYVNANIPEAAALAEKFNIVKAAVAEKAIPYCNIAFLEGAEMKRAMSGYLQVLFEQNPKSVGGTMPGDDFYYQK